MRWLPTPAQQMLASSATYTNPAMAARQANVPWGWLLGGAAVAAGVGAYFCWPRTITDDRVDLQGVSLSRTIEFRGCWEKLPYEAIITTSAGTLRRSFDTLEQAQKWIEVPAGTDGGGVSGPGGITGNPVRTPGSPRSSGPGKPPAQGKEPILCEHGFLWDPVTRTCKPGKPPLPPGGGFPMGPQALAMARRVPNQLATINTPGLYSFMLPAYPFATCGMPYYPVCGAC